MQAGTLSLRNFFIIAMPTLDGSPFERAVAYICEHEQEKGCRGFVINQPHKQANMAEMFDQLGIHNHDPELVKQPIFNGGPEQSSSGFIIHPADAGWQQTHKAAEDIFITTSSDILYQIARRQYSQPSQITLGFSDWAAGQLEQEIAKHYWLTCPAEPHVIFETPIKERWRTALSLISNIRPLQLSPYIGNA